MSLSNFLKLLYNELFKIYVRKSTWAMYIILAVIIVGFGLLNKSLMDLDTTQYTEDNWREVLQTENDELIKESEAIEENPEDDDAGFYISINMDTVEKNNYYLEHDIQPSAYGAWQFVAESADLLSIVSLLTIIIAAGIVAHEFRWGSIKLLLIRPITRTKILFSKYISVLGFASITLFFVLIIASVTGAILFGFEGSNSQMILEHFSLDGDISFSVVSVYNEIVSAYGYGLVNLVMMTTFAFMISSVFRNSSLAIGTAIFLMMGGNIIVGIFMEKWFAKYILFANTNLKQYADGQPLIEGMTLQFSITMLMIYYAIFIGLSWIFFVKRDVSGQ